MRSAMPYLLIAATVSPPPAIEKVAGRPQQTLDVAPRRLGLARSQLEPPALLAPRLAVNASRAAPAADIVHPEGLVLLPQPAAPEGLRKHVAHAVDPDLHRRVPLLPPVPLGPRRIEAGRRDGL